MLSSLENFLVYTERFGRDRTGKYPRCTLPWLICCGWDAEGRLAMPSAPFVAAFTDLMLPLPERTSLLLDYDFLVCFPLALALL